MRVLWLDPGERVGWAAARVVQRNAVVTGTPGPDGIVLGELPASVELRDVTHGIAYLKDCALAVHKAVAIEKRYDVVGYETWRLTAKGAKTSIGSEMPSSQFVGQVRLCCWLAGIPCVGQAPKEKTTALKTLGNHPSGAAMKAILDGITGDHDSTHDYDALLHCWAWFWRTHA